MPMRDHGDERDMSYSRPYAHSGSRPHLKRGWRGALHSYSRSISEDKRREGRLFFRFMWEKSDYLRSVGRSSGSRGKYISLRGFGTRQSNAAFSKAALARPTFWAFFPRMPAFLVRFNAVNTFWDKPEEPSAPEPRDPYQPETRILQVTLCGDAWDQLEELLAQENAFNLPDERTMQGLVEQLLYAWADGWRRPGSWEGSMLDMMGHRS